MRACWICPNHACILGLNRSEPCPKYSKWINWKTQKLYHLDRNVHLEICCGPLSCSQVKICANYKTLPYEISPKTFGKVTSSLMFVLLSGLTSTSCCVETQVPASPSCCSTSTIWCLVVSTRQGRVPVPSVSRLTSPRIRRRGSWCCKRKWDAGCVYC